MPCHNSIYQFIQSLVREGFDICLLDLSDCKHLKRKFSNSLIRCCNNSNEGYADLLVLKKVSYRKSMIDPCILIELKLCIKTEDITRINNHIREAANTITKTPIHGCMKKGAIVVPYYTFRKLRNMKNFDFLVIYFKEGQKDLDNHVIEYFRDP